MLSERYRIDVFRAVVTNREVAGFGRKGLDRPVW